MRFQGEVRSITVFVVGVWLCVFQKLDAQPVVLLYNDIGSNNVSEGLFVTTALYGNYKLGKTILGYGNQFNLRKHNTNFFSGAKIHIDRNFQIQSRQCKATLFYTYNLFSEIIHETNLGIALNHDSKHFSYVLGSNFRTSHLTRKAIEDYNISSSTKLVAKWNLMYLVGISLKPLENRWNAGFRITNIDSFIIHHDTNPMLVLNTKYRLQVPLTLYMETWYKTAGVFNISANSFGFFLRTGVLWELY